MLLWLPCPQATPTSSARSTSTVDADGDGFSRVPSKTSKFSHSVFEPMSARSNSTIEAEEEEYTNLNYTAMADATAGDSDHRNGNRDGGLLGTGSHGNSPRDPVKQSLSVPHTSGNLNNEFVSSHDSVAEQKATKLNSIANNMTSQALSPGVKTPLRSLEYSFQNIKPKTPVNQVRQSPQLQIGRNIAEDYVKKCNMAATKIQRWYRRHGKRRLAADAALKRLLHHKHQEKEEALRQEKAEAVNLEGGRRKTREDKAREARQQAIEVILIQRVGEISTYTVWNHIIIVVPGLIFLLSQVVYI